jgi:hypothetical protein
VSVASLLVFNFFFLPPLHTFQLRDSENWVALAVDLGTALVVSELAARSRRRAAEAVQREREAAALAEVAALLLEAESVQRQLRRVAEHLAGVLGSSYGRIELDSLRPPGAARIGARAERRAPLGRAAVPRSGRRAEPERTRADAARARFGAGGRERARAARAAGARGGDAAAQRRDQDGGAAGRQP